MDRQALAASTTDPFGLMSDGDSGERVDSRETIGEG